MKFSCKQSELVEALSNVQRAVSNKSNMAVLEGILIEANSGNLKFSGYNLEMGIITSICANVENSGSIVLSAKLFTEIVRRLPNEIVVLETDSQFKAHITSGMSEFSLIGIDPKEFPEMPKTENPNTIEIESNILKSMIRQTIFAVADTDSKPIHTGTLFDIKNESLTMVSVDGYRLALRKENIKEKLELRFVVPGKTLSEVLRLIPDSEDKKVKILIGIRHIVFEVENYFIISRLLEGDFLDYQATIPEAFTTKLDMNTKTLTSSVERVSLMVTDRLKSPVRCLICSDKIKLSCHTSIGKANDELECSAEGNSVEIGFNNKYMIDALRNSDTDEVMIQFNGPLSPIKVMPKQGDAFLFLVLPVRLKSE